MLVKLPREALQVAFLLLKKQAIFEGYINIEQLEMYLKDGF